MAMAQIAKGVSKMVSLIVPMPTLAAGADLEQRPILINSDHPENCLALRRHTIVHTCTSGQALALLILRIQSVQGTVSLLTKIRFSLLQLNPSETACKVHVHVHVFKVH